MKTELVTSATGEPLELDEVKDWLRIERGETAEDDLLGTLIETARQTAEDYTGRKLMTQTWKVYFDKWPKGEYFEIPYPPLLAIESSCLTYRKSTGSSTTVWSTGATEWEVDTVSEPGRLHLEYGETWPSQTLFNKNPISIQFMCGYGTTAAGDRSAVPGKIKTAMKLMIGHYYNNREESIVGQTINLIPDGAKALLYSYRIWDHQL